MQRLLTVLTNKVIDQTVNYAYYKTLYPSGNNNVLLVLQVGC